jgi:hypothetical protein
MMKVQKMMKILMAKVRKIQSSCKVSRRGRFPALGKN